LAIQSRHTKHLIGTAGFVGLGVQDSQFDAPFGDPTGAVTDYTTFKGPGGLPVSSFDAQCFSNSMAFAAQAFLFARQIAVGRADLYDPNHSCH
jgi:uncharacterized membrane protein (UPF0182 family)